jgi:hypothetical protein
MATQQRTSGVRRTRPNRLGNQYETVPIGGLQVLGTAVLIALVSGRTWLTQTAASWVLSGVPPIGGGTPENLPVSADIDGDELRLIYSAPLDNHTPFYIPADIAEFRGPLGQYLSAEIKLPDGWSPPPTNATATAILQAGTGVDITLNGAGGPLYLTGLPPIQNNTTGQAAVSVINTGGVIHVEFPVPVLIADQIVWTADPTWWLNSTGGTLDSFDFTMP